MIFNQINEEHKAKIIEIVGADSICTDSERLAIYSRDETEDLVYSAELVITPLSVDAISALLYYCNYMQIPVTPRGGGTGLSGGALPIYGGVLLSLENPFAMVMQEMVIYMLI